MFNKVGSRGCYDVNFKESSGISGVSVDLPVHAFTDIKVLLVRSDLVNFCYESLAYKFSLVRSSDLVLEWSSDIKKFDAKVYRETVDKDYNSTVRILGSFSHNFMRSESDKVQY